MNIDNVYLFVQNNALADIYLRDEYIGELIGIYSYNDKFRGFVVKVNEKSESNNESKLNGFVIRLNSENSFKTRILPNLPDVNQDTLVVYIKNLGNAYFKNKVDISKIIEKL